jgi:hypothetical protein
VTTREVLEAARERISDRERWCQGVLFKGDRACALGSIARARGWNDDEISREKWNAEPALTALAGVLPISIYDLSCPEASVVSTYNDHNSHGCVLAAFDAAIEAATSPVPDHLPCGAEAPLV